MNIKKTIVTIYVQPPTFRKFEERENWFIDRDELLSYKSSLEKEEAAEEAFHLTNAPEELLTEEQKELLKFLQFKGPCLSVGDIVRVEPVVRTSLPGYYLCKSFGWEKFDGEVITLLKHLY